MAQGSAWASVLLSVHCSHLCTDNQCVKNVIFSLFYFVLTHCLQRSNVIWAAETRFNMFKVCVGPGELQVFVKATVGCLVFQLSFVLSEQIYAQGIWGFTAILWSLPGLPAGVHSQPCVVYFSWTTRSEQCAQTKENEHRINEIRLREDAVNCDCIVCHLD